ncbi:glyceraldehyde-3-phosphate dehydrogenase 1 [Scheffersomyces spartinae]|uniref:Glyceraldehyde-3-phosphate dehydrogenase 1 n=1 Tax=Scheffersomyces spartinae TaxID=45513 RepID=A0A9P7VD55_9ASCO|nr:glyceraldehyde-3-phosphate dehydrogenase 1 [Scheffersomyces spartinae]KAG7195622.1 glyceraldehyde-3-phosphate dehydrogenase 1 [Scheffersomyces spartinae]
MATKELKSEISYAQETTLSAPTTEAITSVGVWDKFKDSFKPALQTETLTNAHVNSENADSLSDLERININSANSKLNRKLQNRHLQMISIGSSIGTGLFVGSGSALNTGGPGGIMIAWFIMATAVYTTIQGLGELSTTFPVSGSFNVYASRFIEPSAGFAVGWNYFMQFFVLLPLELVAGAITIKYWNKDINSNVFVIIFWLVIVLITLLGVRWYGEAEFIFSMIKVVTVVGFIILSIVLICGGGPSNEFVGGKYWQNPGPFANGFKGVCSVFVTAGFSFGGTEMIGLTAAETPNPRKTLPKAIKQVFWRISIFYMGTLVMISTLVPYNDSRLMNASSSVDATASPFVIAIVNGGVKGLPSVINAVILISVLSVGNASVYATSRSLNSLAEQGMAPKWAGYIDRAGRPLVAILATDIFGLLALISASNKQEEIFNWLLALSGLSSIFTWISINVSHIRFRAAMRSQGRDLSELPYRSQAGIWGSYYGLAINILVLIAQFWIALFPLGGKPSAYGFFISYLGFPVLLASWVGYKIWKKSLRLWIKAEFIDVDTGRVNIDTDLIRQEAVEEKQALSSRSFIYRVYKFWC